LSKFKEEQRKWMKKLEMLKMEVREKSKYKNKKSKKKNLFQKERKKL
jgi:hypothetical protein